MVGERVVSFAGMMQWSQQLVAVLTPTPHYVPFVWFCFYYFCIYHSRILQADLRFLAFAFVIGDLLCLHEKFSGSSKKCCDVS